ncbi:sugar ABC transporter ATP-binding protein [Kibdelosporangium phytohabitans]|uniref:Sugar ABC transporter ATP-binding protein n=1 Tax=Kibdelosporangium phytohabitans TaxID=860235 RepID=A0A0N9I5F8_9PSEU|nr:sugar ABC transporter ATP-binding protein [Kibdelosporangium phytohabitans]ALG09648.1 sugar ABC transporter ATP-binding protein [Kibdelosporangium phytohabitans]MBE1469009.1 ribose transport system ATP-binding protein [Kibdelosporangium phytohabitans]
MTGEVVLDARAVGKRFPGVVALSEVDLTMVAGEVHALVGENGAGKSTLIKVLTGVHPPDSGELFLQGAPVRFGRPLDAQAAGISTVYQEINLVPLMSVASNLFLGREPRTRLGLMDFRAMNTAAAKLLRSYGVEVDVTRPLRTLGAGVRQMVALARAAATDASVVILDEPTSSLEPREVDTLFEIIDRVRGGGAAVLYVSHRLDELYRICDAVTVLRDGRKVHSGPMADLSRLQLVALMLGRDLEQIRREGTTKFDSAPTETTQTPVLAARGLTSQHLLHGVDVTVRPGEIVGLGGLLGAGRSETVRAIAGSLPVDSGTVTVAGKSVRSGSVTAAMRAGVVMLPEDRKSDGILPDLSVRENIVLAALPRLSAAGLVSRKRQDAIVDTFIERLRIKASSPGQKVGELSGGNQQKVLLARLLCREPKVLLLDEPTRGIDVGAKAEVQALVAELAAAGLGVVLISSEFEEVVEGSDSIVVLREGHVVAELRGADVTEQQLIAALAEGGDNGDG